MMMADDLIAFSFLYFHLKSFYVGVINLWWSSPSASPFPLAGPFAQGLCHSLHCTFFSCPIRKTISLAVKHRCYPSDWTFKVTSPNTSKSTSPKWRRVADNSFGRRGCRLPCPPLHFIKFSYLEHKRDSSTCRVCTIDCIFGVGPLVCTSELACLLHVSRWLSVSQ